MTLTTGALWYAWIGFVISFASRKTWLEYASTTVDKTCCLCCEPHKWVVRRNRFYKASLVIVAITWPIQIVGAVVGLCQYLARRM